MEALIINEANIEQILETKIPTVHEKMLKAYLTHNRERFVIIKNYVDRRLTPSVFTVLPIKSIDENFIVSDPDTLHSEWTDIYRKGPEPPLWY